MKFCLTWHLPHMENSLSSRSILVLEEEEKKLRFRVRTISFFPSLQKCTFVGIYHGG